jgi:hypothetical protein
MPITLDDLFRNTEQKNNETIESARNEPDEVGNRAAQGRSYCTDG